jgi:hypothetical protein
MATPEDRQNFLREYAAAFEGTVSQKSVNIATDLSILKANNIHT